MKIGVRSRPLRRVAFALLFVPIVALGSWRFWHREPPILDIAIVQVQSGNLLSAVTATGTVEARRTVDIKYDTQSPIVGLIVKEGDYVAAGQTVAKMDLSLLEPVLAQARQTRQKDQASLLLAQASLRRSEALAESQVLAQAGLDSARVNYDGLLHLTRADEGAVAQAEEQIKRASLRSPIKGIGADRVLTSGGEQRVEDGLQTVKMLNLAAAGRITIMVGSGINASKAHRVMMATGVELHASASGPTSSSMLHRNERISMGAIKGREYQRFIVMEDKVRRLSRRRDGGRWASTGIVSAPLRFRRKVTSAAVQNHFIGSIAWII